MGTPWYFISVDDRIRVAPCALYFFCFFHYVYSLASVIVKISFKRKVIHRSKFSFGFFFRRPAVLSGLFSRPFLVWFLFGFPRSCAKPPYRLPYKRSSAEKSVLKCCFIKNVRYRHRSNEVRIVYALPIVNVRVKD